MLGTSETEVWKILPEDSQRTILGGNSFEKGSQRVAIEIHRIQAADHWAGGKDDSYLRNKKVETFLQQNYQWPLSNENDL